MKRTLVWLTGLDESGKYRVHFVDGRTAADQQCGSGQVPASAIWNLAVPLRAVAVACVLNPVSRFRRDHQCSVFQSALGGTLVFTLRFICFRNFFANRFHVHVANGCD
jgi:hypothetical protein